MEQLKAVILAAGKGTRMKSDLPKVVHTIEGKCLVDYAIDAAIGAGADDICLVVGYKHEVVEHSPQKCEICITGRTVGNRPRSKMCQGFLRG